MNVEREGVCGGRDRNDSVEVVHGQGYSVNPIDYYSGSSFLCSSIHPFKWELNVQIRLNLYLSLVLFGTIGFAHMPCILYVVVHDPCIEYIFSQKAQAEAYTYSYIPKA
jgi:hypothetical protein